MCDSRRRFGLDIGFIDHLYAQLGTTSNYSVTANIYTSQIIRPPTKTFSACRSLVTASNSGDSSASALKSSPNGGSFPSDPFLHSLPYRTNLVAPVVFFIIPRHGRRRQHRSFSCAIRCHGNVFIGPFPSSSRLFLFVKNLPFSNGHRFAAVA
jgi:hypothetical protein